MEQLKIELDNATFRVSVEDTDKYDCQEMNENKPDYVLWISRSNDSADRHNTLIVSVTDGYDLEEISNWIKSNEQ
jgi:hypothetical protein